MSLRLLLIAFTTNAVIAQLLLRRATQTLGSPQELAALPRFIAAATVSPWIYASLVLQVLGYVLWLIIVSREKLGVATASVGAGFYVLMALSAWAIYGEALTGPQWAGILLVTIGVACISFGHA